jgi:hypothetical protein
MTSYEILKPISSTVLGTHDSGIINVNLSATGNELVDNVMNEATTKEVEALLESESIKIIE